MSDSLRTLVTIAVIHRPSGLSMASKNHALLMDSIGLTQCRFVALNL